MTPGAVVLDEDLDADQDDRLFWRALQQGLEHSAKLEVRRALMIGRMLREGYRPGEIRARTGMSARDYSRAHRRLEDELAGLRAA